MTDRVIPYPGQIPQVEHILETNRSIQDAVHGLLRMTVNGPGAAGFEISPNTPAGMSVVLNEGIISQWAVADATAYSTLPADTSNKLKFGSYAGGTLTGFAAPTGTGQSRKYLISVRFQESDTNQTQIPYYDANEGKSFLGGTQNTKRIQRAIVVVTPGAATNTGLEVPPATPVGDLPLYVVTVSYGQTTITSAHIKWHPDNKFVPYSLMDLRTAIRTKLTGDLSMFISPSGNDNNDGLTALTPKKTLQNVHSVVHDRYDLAGFSVFVYCAPGVYTTPVTFFGKPVGAVSPINWYIIGDEANPSNVTFSIANGICVAAGFGAGVHLRGIKLTCTGTPTPYDNQGYGILAHGASTVEVRNVEFGACGFAHMSANTASYISCMGLPYRISGSAQLHINCHGGTIVTVYSTVTITNSSEFTYAFVASRVGGSAEVYSTSWIGSQNVIGRKFVSELSGFISSGGAGLNYLPGSIAGLTQLGGQYT